MQTKTLVCANVFCTRLKALQKKNDLTSRKLAEALGVSEPTVSQWRSGRHMPDRHLWSQLADLLMVEADDLFFARTKESLAAGEIISEPPSTYRRTDRPMLRPLPGPPGDDEPQRITRNDLESEISYYLDRAERVGALSVAAVQIRKYLNPQDFDYLDKQ